MNAEDRLDKMVERTRVFAIAGLICSGLAAGFLIASFAAPYWVESNRSVSPSGFERMGLWEACFHNYYPVNRPITGKKYEGCWAAISYGMRDLYDHFYPPWMRAVQGMTTLAMLQTVACLLLNIIYFIHCCPGRLERYFALTSAVIAFIAALFLFISAIMFGVHVDQDRHWLPQPDSLYLSWGFGFCILAAILCLVSGMCMTTDFIRLKMDGDPYDRHLDSATSRQSARYSAPPPKYDTAVTYDKRSELAPQSHFNAGYSPQSDSWHDGRKSRIGRTTAAVVPPSHQSEPHSESEHHSESEESAKLNGKANRRHRSRGQYSESEDDEKPKSKNSKGPQQSGRYSEPQYTSDEQTKPTETRSKKSRSRHKSEPEYDDNDTKPRNKQQSDSERPSRRSARHSESDPHERERSRERNSERPSRNSARRSEPRSHSHDEMRSDDRQSNSSRPSRSNQRYSEQPSRDEETRSHSRHDDSQVPSSRRNARHSESQSGREESKLYNRRSASSRSPARQNSHRSESQSRHDGSRQRH